jgi:hypothetical protein
LRQAGSGDWGEIAQSLVSRSGAEVAAWIERLLAHNVGAPVGSEPGFTVAHRVFVEASDSNLQQKMRCAVAELLSQWSPRVHSLDYLYALIVLVGLLRSTQALEEVVARLRRSTFKGVETSGEDLHNSLLRVVAGMNAGRTAKDVLTRDIKEPRYTPICYLCLWQSGGENSLENGLRYLPDLLHNASEVDLQLSLRLFISVATPGVFVEYLPLALGELSEKDLECLFSTINAIGRGNDVALGMIQRGGLSNPPGYYRFGAPRKRSYLLPIERVGRLGREVLEMAAADQVLRAATAEVSSE